MKSKLENELWPTFYKYSDSKIVPIADDMASDKAGSNVAARVFFTFLIYVSTVHDDVCARRKKW